MQTLLLYLFITLATAILITPAPCKPSPKEQRVWTGTNGRTFTGYYHRTLDDGGKKVQFLSTKGKAITVAFDNLSEKDRELVLVFEGKAPRNPAAHAVNQSEFFKQLPTANRKTIPVIEGNSNHESTVHALCVSLLWWDAEGIMPITRKGDFARKMDWIYKEMDRRVAEHGSQTASLKQIKDGLAEYFKKRLKEIGACRTERLADINPDTLSRLTEGNTIVMLKMTLTYAGSDQTYSTAAVLESMTPDGTFAMRMYGRRLTGKMIAVPGMKAVSNRNHVYEFTVANPEEIQNHYTNIKNAKFLIGDQHWNGALIMDPFVYKTPEEKAPIPKMSNPEIPLVSGF